MNILTSGVFHNLFTTFVHVTVRKSMYHIVYPKEKKKETKVSPIPHHGLWRCYSKFTLFLPNNLFLHIFLPSDQILHNRYTGFDVVILSSPFFFQITFFCTLFYLVIKLFTIDTRAFVYLYPLCTQLFSIAHQFNVGNSWKNPTFFFVTSYCLTIWLFIWLLRWIS